jgi:RNA polymerase sigma factor (sigma-70 family)
MAFPQTRLTLIERLALGGENLDWQRFVNDYWGPVCRFALRWGAGTEHDAEDVAAQTFATLWKNRLLVRWMASRSSKLRTMLCGVVRNLLANRTRMLRTRKRLSHEVVVRLEETDREQEHVDGFYAAWVEDLLQKAMRALVVDYYRRGQGDHVRVLYGRVCQRMGIAELAEGLGIKPSDVDNYFRHARQQLGEKLQLLVRQHAERYGIEGSVEDAFAQEWADLGHYLSEYGGMERALGQAYVPAHVKDDG